MSDIYFCPYCNSNQPRSEWWEDGVRTLRCQACGCPVEEEAGEAEGFTFDRTKILCIDDDQLLLGFLADALVDHDFQALTAPDGNSGMAMAKRERPDLILLDVMLPEMDGFEVCRRLRADPELTRIPVVIVTAMLDPQLNAKGLQAGASMAIRKPFDPKQLLTTIRTVLAPKARCPAPLPASDTRPGLSGSALAPNPARDQ